MSDHDDPRRVIIRAVLERVNETYNSPGDHDEIITGLLDDLDALFPEIDDIADLDLTDLGDTVTSITRHGERVEVISPLEIRLRCLEAAVRYAAATEKCDALLVPALARRWARDMAQP